MIRYNLTEIGTITTRDRPYSVVPAQIIQTTFLNLMISNLLYILQYRIYIIDKTSTYLALRVSRGILYSSWHVPVQTMGELGVP